LKIFLLTNELVVVVIVVIRFVVISARKGEGVFPSLLTYLSFISPFYCLKHKKDLNERANLLFYMFAFPFSLSLSLPFS
jgi:hypothetical protein